MERIVAVKKLGKLLGKSLGYRIDPQAATSEEREAARAALNEAAAEVNELKARKRLRYEAILEDTEYQELHKATTAAQDRFNKLRSITLHHKITVGIRNSMFFHVKAEGDSWEEVIAKLENKGSKDNEKDNENVSPYQKPEIKF